MTSLYTKHNYLNKDTHYIISNEIIEYDLQSAGFNLIKKFKLLDDQKIQYLETMGKKQRQIQIGLYQRKDKDFIKRLNDKFVEARKWFFEQNEIKEQDVLAIKKDAIVTTKRCLNTQWDNLEFVEKNIYSSYYYINDIEFYFNRDNIHVKGIGDDKLVLHDEYMLDFLYQYFLMNEVSKRRRIIEFIKEFSHYYKARQLEVGYYRELNRNSMFKSNEKLFGRDVLIEYLADKDLIDIDYNYIYYVLPLVSMLI